MGWSMSVGLRNCQSPTELSFTTVSASRASNVRPLIVKLIMLSPEGSNDAGLWRSVYSGEPLRQDPKFLPDDANGTCEVSN